MTSIRKCTSSHTAGEISFSNYLQPSIEISKYSTHPQRKQNYPPQCQIVQAQSIRYQYCDKPFLLRPDDRFLLQFSGVFPDTQWLSEVTQGVVYTTEIFIGSSFSGPITDFYCNFQVFFMILNSFSEVTQ